MIKIELYKPDKDQLLKQLKRILVAVVALIIFGVFGIPTIHNFLHDNYPELDNKIFNHSYYTDSDELLSIFESQEDIENHLNNIKIADAKDVEYDRESQFGSWKDYSGWSTRDEVLSVHGTETTDNGTAFTSGTWYILYNGDLASYDNKDDISSNLEIDHIIPLSYAYRHGADTWSQDKREEFCNDYGFNTKWSSGTNETYDYPNGSLYGNLVVSDRTSNRAKSDRGPSEWLPQENKLLYAELWIDLAEKYGISITQQDYDTLLEIIRDQNNYDKIAEMIRK